MLVSLEMAEPVPPQQRSQIPERNLGTVTGPFGIDRFRSSTRFRQQPLDPLLEICAHRRVAKNHGRRQPW